MVRDRWQTIALWVAIGITAVLLAAAGAFVH
jgi:hypothetical protein